MEHQNNITKANMIKIIGISLLLVLLMLAFFMNKGGNNPLGLPVDKLHQKDSL